MRVAIDIGHTSGRDQGAVSADGLSEHAFWASVADDLVLRLRSFGHVVQVFRREDYAGSVSSECRAINLFNGDVAVSLHLNSADNLSAGGHEVVHHDGSAKGKSLAEHLDKALDSLPLRDRNTRTPYKGRGDTFLSKTTMPAVILEAAFLSNATDVGFLRAHKDELVKAVAEGIDHFEP